MNKYCDVKKFSNQYLHKVGTQFDNAIYEMEKDRFCVNAISIPENATNGDMIRAMFPNAKIYASQSLKSVNVVTEYGLDAQVFDLSWWNAPYKSESEV